jgi:hypothetical protein
VNRNRLWNCLLCSMLLMATANAGPAPVREPGAQALEVGKPLARFSFLQPATRIYLRYKIVGGRRETGDMWRRQVSFESHEGRRLLHIFWRWDGAGDHPFSRSEDFWFEPETFRPLTVERRLTKDGKITVRGYRFLPDRIEGLAELPDNDQKDFVQPAQMAVYNWETDMELLQTLPLASGYDIRIPFYDAGPGQDAPQYYEYKVLGEDTIASADGHRIKCWIVGIDSSDPQWGPTRIWFAKENQIMIREETRLKDGTIFVKMLLPYDLGREGVKSGA